MNLNERQIPDIILMLTSNHQGKTESGVEICRDVSKADCGKAEGEPITQAQKSKAHAFPLGSW